MSTRFERVSGGGHSMPFLVMVGLAALVYYALWHLASVASATVRFIKRR